MGEVVNVDTEEELVEVVAYEFVSEPIDLLSITILYFSLNEEKLIFYSLGFLPTREIIDNSCKNAMLSFTCDDAILLTYIFSGFSW